MRTSASLWSCWAGLLLLTCCTGCSTSNGFMMNRLGSAAYSRGDYATAASHFRSAIIENPSDPDHHANLAATQIRQGQLHHAELSYQHALRLDPMHQPSYHGLASLLRHQGRHDNASTLLEGWVATQPELPQAHVELAFHRRQLGDVSGAERELRQALSIRPNHAYALAQLGQLHEERGQTQQAMGLYRSSLAINGRQSNVRERLMTLARSPQRNTPQQTAIATAAPQPMGTGTVLSSQPLPAGTIPATAMTPLPLPTGLQTVSAQGTAAPVISGNSTVPATLFEGDVSSPVVASSDAFVLPEIIPLGATTEATPTGNGTGPMLMPPSMTTTQMNPVPAPPMLNPVPTGTYRVPQARTAGQTVILTKAAIPQEPFSFPEAPLLTTPQHGLVPSFAENADPAHTPLPTGDDIPIVDPH